MLDLRTPRAHAAWLAHMDAADEEDKEVARVWRDLYDHIGNSLELVRSLWPDRQHFLSQPGQMEVRRLCDLLGEANVLLMGTMAGDLVGDEFLSVIQGGPMWEEVQVH